MNIVDKYFRSLTQSICNTQFLVIAAQIGYDNICSNSEMIRLFHFTWPQIHTHIHTYTGDRRNFVRLALKGRKMAQDALWVNKHPYKQAGHASLIWRWVHLRLGFTFQHVTHSVYISVPSLECGISRFRQSSTKLITNSFLASHQEAEERDRPTSSVDKERPSVYL